MFMFGFILAPRRGKFKAKVDFWIPSFVGQRDCDYYSGSGGEPDPVYFCEPVLGRRSRLGGS